MIVFSLTPEYLFDALSAKFPDCSPSHGTIFNVLKENNWVKTPEINPPLLKPHHKSSRVEFAIRKLKEMRSLDKHEVKVVHVDETVFPGPEDRIGVSAWHPKGQPVIRPVESKTKPKVLMFLAGVAEPVENNNFNGKIGIWPVVQDYSKLISSFSLTSEIHSSCREILKIPQTR